MEDIKEADDQCRFSLHAHLLLSRFLHDRLQSRDSGMPPPDLGNVLLPSLEPLADEDPRTVAMRRIGGGRFQTRTADPGKRYDAPWSRTRPFR